MQLGAGVDLAGSHVRLCSTGFLAPHPHGVFFRRASAEFTAIERDALACINVRRDKQVSLTHREPNAMTGANRINIFSVNLNRTDYQ